MMRACLAISSFRYDASVLELLERARGDGALELFDRIVVVDSLGTGRMPELLRKRGLPNVDYHCATENLGSAGNLARRLEIASRGAEDVVYAVNHDGSVEHETVSRLLNAARTTPGFGALYPLRRMIGRGGGYDVSGTWSIPVPRRVAQQRPPSPLLSVWWSSSNPALYSLAPVRQGLLPWADLWMGWEDLGYGWLLSREGFPQFVVTDAVTNDGYEFRPVARGRAQISDKPAWYAYYSTRNLLLVTRRTQPGAARAAAVGARIAIEFGVTAVARTEKRTRLRYLAEGVADGIRGRSGKWRAP